MRPLHILVVGDSPIDREFVIRLLRTQASPPFKIMTAESTEIALSACDKNKFDCVLLDYQLPGKTGLDLVRELNKLSASAPPVIMLTGQGNEQVAIDAMKSGASDYLIKQEVNETKLIEAIDNAIRRERFMQKRSQKKSKLEQYASQDSLTELLNRRAFFDAATSALANAEQQDRKIALLYMDLDFFESINERYGHSIGDQLLKQVGQRITPLLRTEDLIARLGGDRYAILLVDLNETKDAETAANKILATFDNSFKLDAHQLNTTASIGVVTHPGSGTPLDKLLKMADNALQKAKNSGRGKIVCVK